MSNININNIDYYPLIDHLPLKRMSDGPRKSPRKSNVEGPSRAQQARKSNNIQCSTCKVFGHNSKTCQRAPMANKTTKNML